MITPTKRTTSALLVAAAAFFAVAAVRQAAADDTIPPNKAQLSSWFQANVLGVASRKGTLDPALVEAETGPPKVIKVPGDFKTITAAVASVPTGNTKRVIISIAGGVYQEKVKIDSTKKFITLYGAPGTNMPTLVYGGTAKQYGTVDSASFIVESDYFVAVNIVFKNSAPLPDGKPNQQALAIRVSGDKAAFYHCRFVGFQDTVCDFKGRHFYKDCYIEGTVDFIFGNAKSIFLNTDLYVLNSGGYTMITAHAGQSKNEDTGFSFVHCSISGTAQDAVLGRAWMTYPRVVFSYTQMSSVVKPAGWSDNFQTNRDSSVFFGEYKNEGPGADLTKRVKFSKELSEAEAKPFLSLAYIEAAKWLLPAPHV